LLWIQAILEAVQLKESNAKGVVVTGCMAQRYAEELSGELPEVDAVVGFEKYSDIGPRIEEIITKSGYTMPTVQVTCMYLKTYRKHGVALNIARTWTWRCVEHSTHVDMALLCIFFTHFCLMVHPRVLGMQHAAAMFHTPC
jgi:tRNA A37 methylthiotransferase MiaB